MYDTTTLKPVVLWRATERSYTVLVLAGSEIIHEHNSGNCRFDSQTYLEPGQPGAISAEELRTFAQSTAVDISREYNTDLIAEDIDQLEESA
jgi:hypothetical protein